MIAEAIEQSIVLKMAEGLRKDIEPSPVLDKDELERVMTITTKRKQFLSQLEDDEFEGCPGITYENGREHLRQRLGSEAFYAVVLHDSGKAHIESMPNAIRGILPRGSCWKALASGARLIFGRIFISVKMLTAHRSGVLALRSTAEIQRASAPALTAGRRLCS